METSGTLGDIEHSLDTLDFARLLLAFVFLTSYALALSRLASARTRGVVALASLAAAAGFVATTSPWEIGALLVAFAVAGMGLFIAAVWLLSLALRGTRRQVPDAARAPAAAEPAASLRSDGMTSA